MSGGGRKQVPLVQTRPECDEESRGEIPVNPLGGFQVWPGCEPARAMPTCSRKREDPMKTMHLLLGNSEQLLSNFIEVLVQDACAHAGLVTSSSVRTVEGLILQGLTGRFDLMIVVPNNLVPDSSYPRGYDAFGEAGQAIRIVKKRCGMPSVALAAFGDRSREETILRAAGADCVLELPFHPEEFARTVRDLLLPARAPELITAAENRISRFALDGVRGLTHWLPARAC